MSKPLSPAYLRLQAARCQRLSRMCMDLGTARDLRLMADEYLADALRVEEESRSLERTQAAQDTDQQKRQERSKQDNSAWGFSARSLQPGRSTC